MVLSPTRLPSEGSLLKQKLNMKMKWEVENKNRIDDERSLENIK